MKVTALAGGVGAAKLLMGLVRVMPPQDLTVIVNTGDDFRCFGLYVCPDLDTVTYSFAGMQNPATGWGMADETFRCLERLAELGCDTWFRLGDRDLATHIYRSHRFQCGDDLTEITASICKANGVQARILPMANEPVPTMIVTTEGPLEFQDYFVRRKCAPEVRGLVFPASERAHPAPGVIEAIGESDLVVLCPSNPFISIGPILAVPEIRPALRAAPARKIGVTPIIAGEALKGPTATMMRQLGYEVSAVTVARLYRDFLDIFVLDGKDRSLGPHLAALGIDYRLANTRMDTMETRVGLAKTLLEIAS